jgi:hypothetical protein
VFRVLIAAGLLLAGCAAQVRIMATPTSEAALAVILHTKKNSVVGRWSVLLVNDGATVEDIPREAIIMALGIPAMTQEEYLPLLQIKAGGRWRMIRNLMEDAGVGIGIGFFPPAAAIGPFLKYLEGRVTTNQIPDITNLLRDLPARVRLSPGDGVTYPLYSSAVHHAHVIGPLIIRAPQLPPMAPPIAIAPAEPQARFEFAHNPYFGD